MGRPNRSAAASHAVIPLRVAAIPRVLRSRLSSERRDPSGLGTSLLRTSLAMRKDTRRERRLHIAHDTLPARRAALRSLRTLLHSVLPQRGPLASPARDSGRRPGSCVGTSRVRLAIRPLVHDLATPRRRPDLHGAGREIARRCGPSAMPRSSRRSRQDARPAESPVAATHPGQRRRAADGNDTRRRRMRPGRSAVTTCLVDGPHGRRRR